MFRITIFFLVFLLLSFKCDKGLVPPESEESEIEFPVKPLGGDLVGEWVPSEVDPVEAGVMDESLLPDFVDSLIISSTLEGNFKFYVNEQCSIYAELTFNPKVYLQGLPVPLELTIGDTITATGDYEIVDENILCLPVQTSRFDLDTLGFTSSEDRLDLITPYITFSYEDLMEFPIYLIFHLTRKSQSSSQKGQIVSKSFKL